MKATYKIKGHIQYNLSKWDVTVFIGPWEIEECGIDQFKPFLCFSMFCVRVRVGFEPQKLQNKGKFL
jgi:hypothetical protein